MKKHIAILSFMLLITVASFSQYTRGTVQESLTIDSEILGKEVKYTVYLPFDYETSTRYYPVVYLLHGYGDNDMGWMQFGEAHLVADELIAKREIPPMILVMPDGGTSFYINNFDNSIRYEDFFVQEFMPFIEKTYRIRSEKRYRGISGLSMGGYGTLSFALKYPEKFAACAAFSAAIFSEDYLTTVTEDKYDLVYAPVWGPDRDGDERLTTHYRKNNPFDVTKEQGKEAYNNLRIFIDCGDDDFLTNDNCRLHIHLNEMGIKHEFRMRDGVHSWPYWRAALPVGLKFIGESFHQF
ncbi:MAG: esterase family protein [Prolixibacteraceae bacterium]|nr:esterase family protein [Prolixibacteraceae bacterium]